MTKFICAIFFLTSPAWAVVAKLDYLLIEVEGTLQKVKANDVITVVAGDKIRIQKAVASETEVAVRNVNLVGYQNIDSERKAEDRGFLIDTHKDLWAYWSEGGKGENYRIKAFNGTLGLGEVTLRVLKPELAFVTVNVNGQERVVRPNDRLGVNASDDFKIQRVSTNLGDDKKVEVKIVPKPSPKDSSSNMEHYEIHFLRNKLVFASIPLEVKGK